MLKCPYMEKGNNYKDLLERGVEEIITKNDLEKKLKSGKKLRIKLGIDPTSPDLHLGHAVLLRKLRQFQDAGHKAVIIIGDFTAQIGDPSGKSEERKVLSEKQIKTNAKTYLSQAGKIIDVKKAEVVQNSVWFKKGGLPLLLQIARGVSIQQILKRDDFQKRIANGVNVSFLESIYPLLQGYDSVAVKADIELGGTDQTFNVLMGRHIQRLFEMEEQCIITFPLLEGTDGVKKMSKSTGNYIAFTDSPENMFGKIMSIPDSLIQKYFILLTDIEKKKITDPYREKMLLAETIVSSFHSAEKAKKAKEHFIQIFSKKEILKDIPELHTKKNSINIVDLLVLSGIKSKSEARRLIAQGAIDADGKTKKDPSEEISAKNGFVLKVGKRKFYKVEK